MSRYLDSLTNATFVVGAAMFPLLMLVIVFNVIMRYLFSFGSIELEELQWHLYAAGFLLCLPKLVREDGNVRIDIIYSKLSERSKRIVNIVGYSLLALPFVVLFVWFARNFVWFSWILNESSEFPSGLPARYIIKFVMLLAFINLGLEVIAKLIGHLRGASQ